MRVRSRLCLQCNLQSATGDYYVEWSKDEGQIAQSHKHVFTSDSAIRSLSISNTGLSSSYLCYSHSLIFFIFNVRQSYCARYRYRLDVCPSACLSVRLSICPLHAGIVSKRLNLSSNCLHYLVAP